MSSSQTLYRAPMLPGNDIGNATTETQYANGRGTPLQLPLPSNNSLANRSFRVRITGRVATTITVTLTINVYFGLSTTISKNTLIFSTGGQSVNTEKSIFEIWLDMAWSADAQTITGRGTGQLANNILGPSTLNNTPVSADPNRDSNTFLQSGATYGFTVTGTFSSSSAGNSSKIDDFALEIV
jgi:hypothetical protein